MTPRYCEHYRASCPERTRLFSATSPLWLTLFAAVPPLMVTAPPSCMLPDHKSGSRAPRIAWFPQLGQVADLAGAPAMPVHIRIADAQGRWVYEQAALHPADPLDLRHLAPGHYVLHGQAHPGATPIIIPFILQP